MAVSNTAPCRVLGAVLAGGGARRFGSDKALAPLHGRPLIDWVTSALLAQVDELVICGRNLPEVQSLTVRSLADRPRHDMGPLGGLCAALYDATQSGFDAVLTVGCDVLPVPLDLGDWLFGHSDNARHAVVVDGQHLIGLWPVALSPILDAHLEAADDLSLRAWIAKSGAITAASPTALFNINTPADLEQFSRRS